MDSEEEIEEIPENGNEEKGFLYVVMRFALALLLPIFAFFIFALLIGFAAVFAVQLSISTPISVPSQCTIVSSSVDLKSSKVCELGLLNYKAKHVFYPFDKTKFRCRYDYYWASVFEVEYRDHSLGETQVALAEAPNEALPLNCRPNFGTAWLTKDKFKVNETYDCWYTSGIPQVTLYRDGFFNCQAKDPSSLEMIRRYFILSTQMLHSWFIQKKGKVKYWRLEMIVGVVTGFSTSLISISFITILQQMKTRLPRTSVARLGTRLTIKRAWFFLLYFSVMGWLIIQYGKRIGLPEIYRAYTR